MQLELKAGCQRRAIINSKVLLAKSEALLSKDRPRSLECCSRSVYPWSELQRSLLLPEEGPDVEEIMSLVILMNVVIFSIHTNV